MVNWIDLTDQITTWGNELGFAAVGVTNTDLGEHEDRLNNWLAADFHGEMSYMSNHGSMRSHPEQLHPQTHSIISLRLDYLEKDPEPNQVLEDKQLAYVSRYALGRDYHKVIRNKLKRLVSNIENYLSAKDYQNFTSRVFTDSAPLLEKALAEKSGLGWIGKNTLLLHQSAGSWFFLGEILTNLPLIESQTPQKNRCGSCSACIDVCPTNAIVAPYQLDARLCISYLTIEHKGSIPKHLRQPMGNRVFGCDDCQLVCPWNRYAKANVEDDFKPRHGLQAPELQTLFSWSEEQFLKNTEGSAIRRTGYQGWLRNIAIGLGNSNHSDAYPGGVIPGSKRPGNENKNRQIIQTLTSKKGISDLVDEHIDWAISEQTTTQV